MLKKAFGVYLFTFSLVSQAATEAIDYELMFNNCIKSSEGSTTGKLGVCAESTSEKIDVEIKALSKKIQARLAEPGNLNAKEALNSFNLAQESWQTYRELHCALAGEYVGSPMHTYCPMKLGIARVKELREFVQ